MFIQYFVVICVFLAGLFCVGLRNYRTASCQQRRREDKSLFLRNQHDLMIWFHIVAFFLAYIVAPVDKDRLFL